MAKSATISLSLASGGAPPTPDRGVVITPAKFEIAAVDIIGIAPYVQHKFSAKAQNTMIETQQAGQQAKKGRRRDPKNFDSVYDAALYKSMEGWHGMPASAFRNACISACRIVGFKMTIAKLSIFFEADGFDAESGTPLIRITKGEPEQHFAPARNSNGSTDIRCRPMWRPGWEATIRVRWDADQFSASDIANLIARVGLQVGIGEGRPDSRMSAGVGWGMFRIKE